MPYTVAELEFLRQLVARATVLPEDVDFTLNLLGKLITHIKRQRSSESYNSKPRRSHDAF